MTALASKLKAAMASTRKVEIVKGKWPGDKLVMVDGKLWAEAPMESHGRRGTSYTFRQLTGVLSPRFRLVPTPSIRSKDRTDTRPVSERLQETAERLVREGHLIDPEEIASGLRAAAEEQQRKVAIQLQRERDKRHKKAEACLARIAHKLTAQDVADVTAAILDAMTWAQSK